MESGGACVRGCAATSGAGVESPVMNSRVPTALILLAVASGPVVLAGGQAASATRMFHARRKLRDALPRLGLGRPAAG